MGILILIGLLNVFLFVWLLIQQIKGAGMTETFRSLNEKIDQLEAKVEEERAQHLAVITEERAQHQAEVEDLNAEIATLNDAAAENSATIAGLEAEIALLKDQIADGSLEQLDQLGERLDQLNPLIQGIVPDSEPDPEPEPEPDPVE